MKHKVNKSVVIGTIGEDAHMIGGWVLSEAYKEAGFKVTFLGAVVPQEEFVNAAVETDADAILVSSSYGMGISFTGDVLINRVPVSESLVFFKLGDQEAARRVHFYYKRNRYLSRTVRAFLTCASDPSDLPQPSPGPSSPQ